MKIGYTCINRTVKCCSARKFRLSSYSEERLIETTAANLMCLEKILEFNRAKSILFFRITSDLIPFASHPVCRVDWEMHFKSDFDRIGKMIRTYDMRISMHPDQFVLLNSPKREVLENSISELKYHAKLLDLMGLDKSAKIQIHVGGVYGKKKEAMERFIDRYKYLPENVRERLVIENDERLYSLVDCLSIHNSTGIPVLLDVFHHSILGDGITQLDSLKLSQWTWLPEDGIPVVDYSTQQGGARKGKHTESIDLEHFSDFLRVSSSYDFDIMLEIKDKELSAQSAIRVAQTDERFSRVTKGC